MKRVLAVLGFIAVIFIVFYEQIKEAFIKSFRGFLITTLTWSIIGIVLLTVGYVIYDRWIRPPD